MIEIRRNMQKKTSDSIFDVRDMFFEYKNYKKDWLTSDYESSRRDLSEPRNAQLHTLQHGSIRICLRDIRSEFPGVIFYDYFRDGVSFINEYHGFSENLLDT